MLQFIAAVLVVAVAQAATIDVFNRVSRELLPVPVAILRQSQVANDDGSYQYGYSTHHILISNYPSAFGCK